MSAHEANNRFDLLRLERPETSAVELDGSIEPQLGIDWGAFHQGLFSNFAELFRRAGVPRDPLTNPFLRDASIERRLPRRAIFAAALWHVAFLALPLPEFSVPRRNHAFDNTEITWSGPIEDFPLIETRAPKAKPSPRGRPGEPPAPEGADAFHPRQTLFTDPVHPNHPRQTLVRPAAPPVAPKILPNLPNMVELAQSAAPVRPRLEISAETLRKLRPREKRVATDTSAPAPDVQASEQSGDLSLRVSDVGPERPQLALNTGAAPRLGPRKHESAAEPAPDVPAQLTSPNGRDETLIALSATPGPPAPAAPPSGNLAARVTISPEGKKPGVPGGAADAKGEGGAPEHAGGGSGAGSGSAANPAGTSITGGAPRGSSTVAGSAGGKIAVPSAKPLYSRRDAAAERPPEVESPPNFAALAPEAKPEAIFARRRIYSMNVNMPNLNSATGSWILNFAVMHTLTPGSEANPAEEIAEPAVLRKVDPKYPPTAVAEHIEGEVVLYAVIRRDGSVDSIQLVKGIDPQLDTNAMRALAQWKFRPAERQGDPVDLEAIVHIPFRGPERE
jgi:TonB family protein